MRLFLNNVNTTTVQCTQTKENRLYIEWNLLEKSVKRPLCCTVSILQSPKFKRVSLNETLEFPFWRLNICVDFGLRNSQQMENMKKPNKIIFHNKHIDIHKTIRETRVSKLVFITILCLKFWAQCNSDELNSTVQ